MTTTDDAPDVQTRLHRAVTLGYYLLGLYAGARLQSGRLPADELAHLGGLEAELAKLRGVMPGDDAPPPQVELAEASAEVIVDFVIWSVRRTSARTQLTEDAAPAEARAIVHRYAFHSALSAAVMLTHEVERLRIMVAEARAGVR